MNEIKIFENEQFGKVRTAVNECNEPLFCLADVCIALDLTNPSMVKSRLNAKGISIADTPTKGGVQQLIFINEPNLYKCIFQSRKADAEQFQDWVCEKILPSIRQTGGYVSDTSRFVDSYFGNMDDNSKAFLIQSLDNSKKLFEENKKQRAIIKEQAPKVEFFDAVTDSTDAIDMATAAKVLNMGIGRNRLFELLRDKKVLNERNIPFQSMIDAGYFRIIEQRYIKPDGTNCINIKTIVYQKGLNFIRKVLSPKKN